MRRKPTLYTELCYLFGVALVALSAALMARADFGLSMVVAPAYLLHRKLAQTLPFFTFGMAEYCFQALLLLLLAALLRRFRLSYLFSFFTAVLYGLVLDGWMALTGLIPEPGMAGRIAFFAAGLPCCALGVSLLFHTYISSEVYELFVMELARVTGREIHRLKLIYDWSSCLLAVVLSFCFFGFGVFVGIGAGTAVCTVCNGPLIRLFSRLLERRFDFRDALKARPFFER